LPLRDFVKNYEDMSDDNGHQFKFLCDICGDGYMSDVKLSTYPYSKYLYASKNHEALRLLRERFFARIIHTTYENWQRELLDALSFNTKALDDYTRWSKSATDQPEDC